MGLDDKIYRPGPVHGQISRAKNSLITPPAMYGTNAEIMQFDRKSGRPRLFEIYQQYQNRLRTGGNSMDLTTC